MASYIAKLALTWLLMQKKFPLQNKKAFVFRNTNIFTWCQSTFLRQTVQKLTGVNFRYVSHVILKEDSLTSFTVHNGLTRHQSEADFDLFQSCWHSRAPLCITPHKLNRRIEKREIWWVGRRSRNLRTRMWTVAVETAFLGSNCWIAAFMCCTDWI